MLQNQYHRVIMLRVSVSGQHFIGMSPSGKAPDFDSGIRRFKSCHPSHNDPLAQLAEQLPFKQWVRSSNLRRVTKKADTIRCLLFWFPPRRFEELNATRTSVAAASWMAANLNFAFRQNANEFPAGHVADRRHPLFSFGTHNLGAFTNNTNRVLTAPGFWFKD